MTTAEQDAAVRAALTRLQDSPRSPGQSIAVWLDAHQKDVITLCLAKGQQITQDLLGIGKTNISAWKLSRHLEFKSPSLSRDGAKTLTPQNLAPPRPPAASPTVRNETPDPPAPEDPQYVLGQRDAIRFLHHLLGASPIRYCILEDGRVVEIATGKIVPSGGS